MSISLIAGIIIFLVVVSLVVSSISYNRQKAIAERVKKIKQYKSEAKELLNHIYLLLNIDEDYSLLLTLQRALVAALSNAQDLDASDAEINQAVANERTRLAQFKDAQRVQEVEVAQDSDEALAKCTSQIAQLNKLLDIMANGGRIPLNQAASHKEHLRKLLLDLNVESHFKQASIYGEQGDVALFLTHMKQARDALSKSSLTFDGKNERIKMLSERIDAARKNNKIILDTEPENEDESAALKQAPDA